MNRYSNACDLGTSSVDRNFWCAAIGVDFDKSLRSDFNFTLSFRFSFQIYDQIIRSAKQRSDVVTTYYRTTIVKLEKEV